MPVSLAKALREAGQEVETVKSLKLAGIDNGALLRLARQRFDLCFSKDGDFAKRAREARGATKLKVLRVKLEQKPAVEFVRDFMGEFKKAEWSRYENGAEWP